MTELAPDPVRNGSGPDGDTEDFMDFDGALCIVPAVFAWLGAAVQSLSVSTTTLFEAGVNLISSDLFAPGHGSLAQNV